MNHRIIHLLFADSLAEAKAVIEQQYKPTNLTTIDTSTDFNQNKWLGQELSDTIIYITPTTRINGILAVCGCVKGGSHLFFVFQKETYPLFYKNFFIPRLEEAIINQEKKLNFSKNSYANLADYCIADTDDIIETRNINRLKTTVKTGQITHLIGQRGTGKSTLLGFYIRELCKDSNKVLLLSPSRLSSHNTLKYLDTVSRETFFFFTPYSLDLSILSSANNIIVDEAASINRELLEKINQNTQANIIFSTTIDGYEGTGQSYRLSYLNQKSNNIIKLTEPKRFSADDEIYQLSQQLCEPQNNHEINLSDKVELYSSKTMQEKNIILPTFALLQTAHYRTTPNDFANFYDNNTKFITTIKNKKLIGAIHLFEEELPISQENRSLITDIINGKRRVKNAMTQQSIINSYGDSSISNSKILRISRIATEKNYRRQGIATKMIKHLSEVTKEKNIDFISTSFSGNPEILKFWLSQGFIVVRIGINKNKWHNEFSLLMLKPLSENNENITKQLCKYFNLHYRYYREEYSTQAKDLSFVLESSIPNINDKSNNDWKTIDNKNIVTIIDSVILHHRDIHWILPIINVWIKNNYLPNNIRNKIEKSFSGNFLNKANKTYTKDILKLLKQHILSTII